MEALFITGIGITVVVVVVADMVSSYARYLIEWIGS